VNDGIWLNQPKKGTATESGVVIQTEPETDLWQRTYYGFRVANAPAYLWESDKNFSFSVKASFDYKGLFDQCGIILFIDDENWFKASIEYENSSSFKLIFLLPLLS
jgi:uncharacterized protein